MRHFFYILIFLCNANVAWAAYDCQNINRLEQYGSVDYDLWCMDDKGELPEIRVHKSLSAKDATSERLVYEQNIEIDRASMPPEPPPAQEPTVDDLKAQIVTLQAEIVELKKPKPVAEVIG